MGWQTEVAIQLQAGNTIINQSGTFVYSGAPAAGNLATSDTPAGGVDQFGNNYLQGVSSYGTGFASQMGGGFIILYTGSLAAGWTLRVQIECNSSGDLLLIANRQVVTAAGNILDDGAGNATVVGTLSVNGSGNTGTSGLTNGTINGTSGPASAGTAHTHGGGSYAVNNGQHNHVL